VSVEQPHVQAPSACTHTKLYQCQLTLYAAGDLAVPVREYLSDSHGSPSLLMVLPAYPAPAGCFQKPFKSSLLYVLSIILSDSVSTPLVLAHHLLLS
jgi:hypothetical protein